MTSTPGHAPLPTAGRARYALSAAALPPLIVRSGMWPPCYRASRGASRRLVKCTVHMTAERQRDADRTRTEILDVATAEFADRGYSGARVDEIAARTRTTKRMIYYYFGGKEQLYIAV